MISPTSQVCDGALGIFHTSFCAGTLFRIQYVSMFDLDYFVHKTEFSMALPSTAYVFQHVLLFHYTR